jgi:hypothetical protein
MSADDEVNEILQLMQEVGPTKASRKQGEFYSQDLPRASDAFAAELARKKAIGEKQQELVKRGNVLPAARLANQAKKPRMNVAKTIGPIAHAKAGQEGVTAVRQEFSKSPEDWLQRGQEVLEGAGDVWGKITNVGGKLLKEGGEIAAADGQFVRHAIMAATDPDVKFNPYAAATGRAPGSQTSDFRKWAESGKTATGYGFNKLSELAAIPVGAAATLPIMGYQYVTDQEVDAKKAYQTGHDFTKDVALDFVTSPSNALSFGGSTVAKTLPKQAAKMAAESGMKGAAAKTFMKSFTQEALTAGKGLGEIGGGQRLKQFAVSQGVKPEVFSKVVGEAGEFTGKRGLAVFGKQVGNFETGKLLGKARNWAGDKSGLDILKLNAPDRDAFLQAVAKSQGIAEEATDSAIKKAISRMPEEKKAALLADKQALKKWGEGFFKASVSEKTGKKIAPLAANQTGKQLRSLGTHIKKLEKQGLVTSDQAEAMLNQAKKRMLGTEPWLENKLAKATANLANKAHTGVADYMRQGMFGKIGYHAQNVKDDLLLGFIGGGDSVRGWANSLKGRKTGGMNTDVLFKTDVGEKLTRGDYLKELTENGVIGAGDRLAKEGKKLSATDAIGGLQKSAGMKVSDTGLAETLGSVPNLFLNKPGKKLASKWDDAHRAAVYTELRMKGHPPKLAAQKLNDLVFNYADPGMFPGLLKTAKLINPFIGWGYRAVSRVPKAIAANPVKAGLLPNLVRNTGADNKYREDEVPEHLRKNLIANVPDSAKGLFNKGMKLLSAEPVREGQGLKTTVREPGSGAKSVLTDLSKEQSLVGGPIPNLFETWRTGKNSLGMESTVGNEALKLAAGSILPRISETVAAYTTAPDFFKSKDKASPTPRRDALLNNFRWLTGETVKVTSGDENIKDIMYNDEQDERIKKLGQAKAAADDEALIKALEYLEGGGK